MEPAKLRETWKTITEFRIGRKEQTSSLLQIEDPVKIFVLYGVGSVT